LLFGGDLISLIIELIDFTALIDLLLFGSTPCLRIVRRVRVNHFGLTTVATSI
jgi:hypothetical protein